MADTFTTNAKVKLDAGFENNANISEVNDIKIFTDSANAEVLSAVASKYVLPLSDNANYVGSPAELLLVQVATTLGSGMALSRQYEGQGSDIMQIGVDKKANARDTLKRIMNGRIRLIDTASIELNTLNPALSSVSGFPKNATDNPPRFTIDKKY